MAVCPVTLSGDYVGFLLEAEAFVSFSDPAAAAAREALANVVVQAKGQDWTWLVEEVSRGGDFLEVADELLSATTAPADLLTQADTIFGPNPSKGAELVLFDSHADFDSLRL
jgi:hypothetical protein